MAESEPPARQSNEQSSPSADPKIRRYMGGEDSVQHLKVKVIAAIHLLGNRKFVRNTGCEPSARNMPQFADIDRFRTLQQKGGEANAEE